MLHVDEDLPALGVGDTLPGVDLAVVDDDGQPIDIDAFTGASGSLVDPSGASVPVTVTPLPDSDRLAVLFPAGYVFTLAGVYSLLLTLAEGNASVSVDAVPLIAEERTTGWATLAHARGTWRDAPRRDLTLWTVLDTARLQVAAYAPALLPPADGEPVPVPAHYRQAQLMQARNVWNAAKTDPTQAGIGDDGLVIRPYPMDWVVKGIIRPRNPVPTVR